MSITASAAVFCKFWFTSDFFTVGLFAFGGVGLRVAITNALAGCIEQDPTSHYGPFMQIFYSEPYLASNLLGCFIMAFCIAHIEQVSTFSAPLYKGLTTGFCGSLTTFSSWMNGAVYMVFDKNWYKIFIMIALEFWLTWAAFTMGYAAAKIVTELHGDVMPYFVNFEKSCRKPPRGAYDQATDALEGDLELQQPGRLKHSRSAGSSTEIALGPEPIVSDVRVQQGQSTTDGTLLVVNDDEDIHESKKEIDEANAERAAELDLLQALDAVTDSPQVQGNTAQRSSPADALSSAGTAPAAPQTDQAMSQEKGTPLYAYLQRYEYYSWGGLFSTIAVILWVILILEPEMGYFDHRVWRNTYRSVALAPLGAWLRWGLTRFPRIKALWPEMHPQTLIANLGAVTLMCVLNVFADSSWVYAINAGINGSLSTVSTFFAELHNLYLEKGPLSSLRYAFPLQCTSCDVLRCAVH
jgi:fluoride ion exporter CrcB/FEX